MARRNKGRSFRQNYGRQGRLKGDWETSSGVGVAGPPTTTLPAKWGGGLICDIAGNSAPLPVNNFYVGLIGPQIPTTQGIGISVGAAVISEIDVKFEFVAFANGTNYATAVMGIGLYLAKFSRSANSWEGLDPLNPGDMTRDDWIVHRQGTFIIPNSVTASGAGSQPETSKLPSLSFRWRGRLVFGQGEAPAIVISNLSPPAQVNLAGVSWQRWRYSRVY